MQENAGLKAFTAGEALATNRLVKLSAGSVVYADSDEAFIGSTEFACDSGEDVTVRLKNVSGTVELVAAEAVAAGATLYTGADGTVASTNPGDAGTARAIAIEAATAAGNVIECFIL